MLLCLRAPALPLKKTKQNKKTPKLADLSGCMCSITVEITALCLPALLSEISLCWQAVDRAVLLLCSYCVSTAGRTCLTLFWTSSAALNLYWFADICAVGFWALKQTYITDLDRCRNKEIHVFSPFGHTGTTPSIVRIKLSFLAKIHDEYSKTIVFGGWGEPVTTTDVILYHIYQIIYSIT